MNNGNTSSSYPAGWDNNFNPPINGFPQYTHPNFVPYGNMVPEFHNVVDNSEGFKDPNGLTVAQQTQRKAEITCRKRRTDADNHLRATLGEGPRVIPRVKADVDISAAEAIRMLREQVQLLGQISDMVDSQRKAAKASQANFGHFGDTLRRPRIRPALLRRPYVRPVFLVSSLSIGPLSPFQAWNAFLTSYLPTCGYIAEIPIVILATISETCMWLSCFPSTRGLKRDVRIEKLVCWTTFSTSLGDQTKWTENTDELPNDTKRDHLHAKIRTLRSVTNDIYGDIYDDAERQNLMLYEGSITFSNFTYFPTNDYNLLRASPRIIFRNRWRHSPDSNNPSRRLGHHRIVDWVESFELVLGGWTDVISACNILISGLRRLIVNFTSVELRYALQKNSSRSTSSFGVESRVLDLSRDSVSSLIYPYIERTISACHPFTTFVQAYAAFKSPPDDANQATSKATSVRCNGPTAERIFYVPVFGLHSISSKLRPSSTLLRLFYRRLRMDPNCLNEYSQLWECVPEA
ncbi:hypothetical protein SISNIDRAFT_490684 [Sistotremastrum niveocremeum HHB9708]|uniref:Uncharacterized protein n=1 Tax=Sistotremastrum niveocremeum HHB9708 TaxID=1314777 RepID=A0A164NNK7_9AGAM|nr:hypothetical protein SISNIDRAFT_490684 [Sistotremastrum niveocremeum HHB9708]